MTDSNWLIILATSQRKALIDIGYSPASVNLMDLKETTKELKLFNYDFKKNSPLKNK
jgi:hypothetical protein